MSDHHSATETHPAHHEHPHDHTNHDHTDPDQQEHGDHEGHGAHGGHGHAGHGDHVGQFRRLFWWMLLLAVPVVGLSEMFAMLVGYDLPRGEWITWVSPSSARSCS